LHAHWPSVGSGRGGVHDACAATTMSIAMRSAISSVPAAEAKALEAQGQALRSNTSLIQLEVAKRWSGNLPVNMYCSAPLPLLKLPAETQQAIPR
jgi:hypothetical protein